MLRAVLRFRRLDVQLLRDQPQSLGKADIFDLLHEADDIAGNPAAETVVELAGGMDGERGCLLLVKRTEADQILGSALFELDVFADDANDIGVLFDDRKSVCGSRGGHGDSIVIIRGPARQCNLWKFGLLLKSWAPLA